MKRVKARLSGRARSSYTSSTRFGSYWGGARAWVEVEEAVVDVEEGGGGDAKTMAEDMASVGEEMEGTEGETLDVDEDDEESERFLRGTRSSISIGGSMIEIRKEV